MVTKSIKPAPRMQQPKQPKRLVHRLAEWDDLILPAVEARRQAPVQKRSIINIFGAPGQGKTTLLNFTLLPRLKKLYTPRLPIAFVNFDRDYVDAKYDLPAGRGRLVLALIEQLSRSVKLPLSTQLKTLRKQWEAALVVEGDEKAGEALFQAEEALVGYFNLEFTPSLLVDEEKRPVVLILDTAEELERDFIRWIQASLQGPSTDTGYVLWIIASRQPVDCQLFYIRSRFAWHELKSFDKEQVKKQIASQDSQLVDTVIHYSRGLPAATERISNLIDELRNRQERKLTSEDLRSHREELIDGLSDLIDYYLRDLDQRIQQSIWVLSPLRLLNPAIITKALPQFLPKLYPSKMIGDEPLDVLDHLIARRLVYWDRSRRGYVIEEPIRQIIARVLRYDAARPTLYADIHRWAQDHFSRLAEQVPDKRLDYLIESLYHRAMILVELEEAPNVVEKLAGALRKQMMDKKNGVDNPEALDQLRRQIETDQDFQELLGDDLARLIEALSSVDKMEGQRPGR